MNIEYYLETLAATISVFIVTIVYTKINGLRSFSKISSFDFAMTIAVGSVLASVAVRGTGFLNGLIAMGVLYFTQAVIARLRRKYKLFKTIDNKPLLLVEDGKVIQKNLTKANVTEYDIAAKLRKANVGNLSSVNYVVLETTGDVSVVHGKEKIDNFILEGVSRS